MASTDTTQDDQRRRTTGELVGELSEQTSNLIRQEIELAKAELAEKGKAAGTSAGMFGGAGVVGFLALSAATAAVILLLDRAMDTWLAALIVAVIYGAIAGALALAGRDRVREAAPPVPEQTIETVKENAEWARSQAKSANR